MSEVSKELLSSKRALLTTLTTDTLSSKGASSNTIPATSNTNSEEEMPTPSDFSKMNISVRFKDTSISMLQFTNSSKSSLRWSTYLAKNKLKYDNGDLIYTSYSNFSYDHLVSTSIPKSFIERIFYTQEQVCILIDKLLNYFSKYMLATIDNKAYHFKDILKQLDKAGFIKAIEKKINVH